MLSVAFFPSLDEEGCRRRGGVITKKKRRKDALIIAHFHANKKAPASDTRSGAMSLKNQAGIVSLFLSKKERYRPLAVNVIPGSNTWPSSVVTLIFKL